VVSADWDVVVVGAGIVGASVGYHLARAGADVLLLDGSLPASGASGSSFAWIGRGTATAPPEQLLLRREVLADYRRLEHELPGVRVRWTGSLSWGADGPGPIDGDGEGGDGDGDGGDGRLVDAAEVARVEPALRRLPARAAFQGRDGAVDPVAVTHALVDGMRGHGGQLWTGVTTHHLAVRGSQVVGVETTAGLVAGRTVVVAAGADAPGLCAPLGYELPVSSSPALLMRFTAPPGLVRTLVANDQFEVREAADGQLLVAWDHDGQTTAEELHRAGQQLLTRLQGSFADAADVELVSVRVGRRPMPADGSPVVGPVPRVAGDCLAVMHSGVTLAATVGRLVAAEIVDGASAPELTGLRPSRFT